MELCESLTPSNIWPWDIFSSLAVTISLSRDELSLSSVSTKLWIMNVHSREWLNTSQWVIQERAKQMKNMCCKAQALQSESATPALGFYFSILLNLLFLCWDPLQSCKQTLWAGPSKLTWDGERLLPQLGQGSTDMFGRDSVDKVKFKLFFLHKRGYFVTILMIDIFRIGN